MVHTLTSARFRAVPVLLGAATGQWLLWRANAPALARAVETVLDADHRGDPDRTGQLVVDVAMTLTLVAGTWLVAATVITVLAQIAPCSALRRYPTLGPAAWRRVVIALLGTGVLAISSAASGAENAGGTGNAARDRWAAPGGSPLRVLDGLPYPDRPTGGTPPIPSTTDLPAPETVVVRVGDSLWSLAADARPHASDAELSGLWPRWYARNRSAIGPDPDLITPGTVLDPPEQP